LGKSARRQWKFSGIEVPHFSGRVSHCTVAGVFRGWGRPSRAFRRAISSMWFGRRDDVGSGVRLLAGHLAVRVVKRDLFLELIHCVFQRLDCYFSKFGVAAGFRGESLVTLGESRELDLRVVSLVVVFQAHRITSMIPLGTPARSVAKVTFMYSSSPLVQLASCQETVSRHEALSSRGDPGAGRE
jgi:hypothetical protein